MENTEELEFRVSILRTRVEKLPTDYQHIGQRALDLCQQRGITLQKYTEQMQQFPELKNESKNESKRNRGDLLLVTMLAGNIVIKRNDPTYM